jgi:hypothetical protein
MSFRNLEIKDLVSRLKQVGPEWTKKVYETDEKWKVVRQSIVEIDELISNYKFLVSKSRFSTIDADRIESALSLVCEEQGLALRKDAKLYPIHPIEVSYNILKDLNCRNVNLVVGGLLHDIIEDVEYYTYHPEIIGDKFGFEVQEIVQGMTNKLLPNSERREFVRRIQISLGNDDETTQAVFKNIEYFIGVKKKLQDPRVLIVKSYDLRDNTFRLSNLDSNKTLQLKLANKYLPLMDVFVERFTNFADNAEKLGVSMEGALGLSTRFREEREKLETYAKQWKHYNAQQDVMRELNLI